MTEYIANLQYKLHVAKGICDGGDETVKYDSFEGLLSL